MGRGLLIIVSGMIIVFGIIQNSINDRKNNLTKQNASYAAKTQAKNIANSMADLSFQELQEKGFKTGGQKNLGFFKERPMMNGEGSAPAITTYMEDNYEIKEIKGVGTYKSNGKKITTTVTLKSKRRPFSKYSYFTESEGSRIYFGSRDVFNGPVHSNGTLKFDGDAVFNGEVTSAEEIEKNGNDPVFNGKTDFNTDKIDLPVGGEGDEQIQNLVDKANNGGLHYDNEIEVNFKGNGGSNSQGSVEISTIVVKTICTGTEKTNWFGGTYCSGGVYKKVKKRLNTTTHDLGDNSFNGVISSSKNVHVKGNVNGDVTLHSSKDVRIDGDVRYEDNPRNHDEDDPPSDDYLGIVSEEQTIVDKDAHKDHGTEDLDIDASIMALADNESFTVEDHDRGQNRGSLNLFGGVIQRSRGPVATAGYGGRTGYEKNYTYDSRFLSHSPKGFPKTGKYDRFAWSSETEVDNISN